MSKLTVLPQTKQSIDDGVPQGLPVGLTLFYIHINCITRTAGRSSTFLYADDIERHHSGSNLKVILQDLTDHMQNIAFGLCFSLLKKLDLECEEV